MDRKEKWKQSILNKYGTWEAYIENQRAHASEGGKKSGNRPFKNKKLASEMGKRGANARYGNNKAL